jgi:UDP-2,3-diacylglucosamine hydrolase
MQNSSNQLVKSLFISDLHLTDQQPELINLFNKFIDSIILENNSHNTRVENLFILGDFFNYWIGSDNSEPWHHEIMLKFKELAKHTKIYFLCGNRDFLINEATSKLFNFNLIKTDTHIIHIDNKNIVLLHGDTLCTNDKNYQRFRKFIRNPIIKLLFLALPLTIRQKLAKKAKQQSIKNNTLYNNSSMIFDVTKEAVLQLFKTSNSNIIIHGHTHRPNVHQYNSQNIAHTRYVLGDWHHDGAYYLEINNQQSDLHGYNLKYFKST